MAKSEAIEVEGVVLEKLPNARNRRWTRNFSSHQWKA